jgi:long-chain acyl-CoA synthetase
MTAGVTAGERFRSWTDIQASAARAASGFAGLGLAEDDSVALMLRNDFATFEVNMAAGQLGIYAVPINWHFTPEEAGYILADSGAKVLVAHSDLLAQIAGGVPANVTVLVVPTPEEIAAAYNVPAEKRRGPEGVETWDAFVERHAPNVQAPKAARGSMIYTSGTTGRPKGVRRRPSTPELQALAAGEAAKYWGIKADPSSVVLMNGPMYHSAPAAYGMGSARLGLNMVLQARFEAEDMLRLIDRHKVSHMHIVPTMFVRLLRLPDAVKRRYDLSSLRWITHGAAPCAPAVKRQMIEWWGPVINEYYGATETGIVVWHDSQAALAKPGTVGRVVEGAVMRIVDAEGRDVKQGEVG